MIVVDSSVWIAHLRDAETPSVCKLRTLERASDIIVGDLVLLEVLQGARDARHAARIEGFLRTFAIERMLDERRAILAAAHYRELRGRAVTIRRTTDLIIGAFCLSEGHALLHDDRDFDAMEEHLGLQVY